MNLKEVKDLVEEFGPQKNIFVKSRKQDICYARNIFFKISRDHVLRDKSFGKKVSFAEIGRFSGFDHATVMHGIQRLDNLLSINQKTDFAIGVKNVYNKVLSIVISCKDYPSTEDKYKVRYLKALEENSLLKKELADIESEDEFTPLFNSFPKDHPDAYIRLKALIGGLNMRHGKDKVQVFHCY